MRYLSVLTYSIILILIAGCQRNRNPDGNIVERQHKSRSYKGNVVFRMADPAPENHPSARASSYFASLVTTRTSGKIRIRVYYNGRLGTTKEVFEQLKFGGIALGRVSFAELTDAVPSLEYYARQVIRGPYNCRNWIEKNGEKIMTDCQTEKIYPLAVFNAETRCFYSISPRFQLKSPRDIENVRIGTISCKLLQDVLKQYGAVPVDIVSEDTYQSMRNGYMNVRESELSDFILSNDYRFINYVTLSTYISSPGMIIMSSEASNDISIEQRKIITDCARQAAEYQHTVLQNFYDANIPLMRKTKTVLQGAL
jgi:TRAP-type C4-dicarboxylate transport system substrate-binding protein